MFVIRFFFRSGSRCPLCENGLRKVLIKSVILRRVLQRYGESSDRQSCFYQQCSYGRGRRGQVAEGQEVALLKKKFTKSYQHFAKREESRACSGPRPLPRCRQADGGEDNGMIIPKLKKKNAVTFVTVYVDNPAYFCIVIEIV